MFPGLGTNLLNSNLNNNINNNYITLEGLLKNDLNSSSILNNNKDIFRVSNELPKINNNVLNFNFNNI